MARESAALTVWDGTRPKYDVPREPYAGELLAEDAYLVDCLRSELLHVVVIGRCESFQLSGVVGKYWRLIGIQLLPASGTKESHIVLDFRCESHGIRKVLDPPSSLEALLEAKKNKFHEANVWENRESQGRGYGETGYTPQPAGRSASLPAESPAIVFETEETTRVEAKKKSTGSESVSRIELDAPSDEKDFEETSIGGDLEVVDEKVERSRAARDDKFVDDAETSGGRRNGASSSVEVETPIDGSDREEQNDDPSPGRATSRSEADPPKEDVASKSPRTDVFPASQIGGDVRQSSDAAKDGFVAGPAILQVTEWGKPTLYESLPPVLTLHEKLHLRPTSVADLKSRRPPFECRLVAGIEDVLPNGSSSARDFVWASCLKCGKSLALRNLVCHEETVPRKLRCPLCARSKLSLRFLLVFRLADPSGAIFAFAKCRDADNLLGGHRPEDVREERGTGAERVSKLIRQMRPGPKLYERTFVDVVLSAYGDGSARYYRIVHTRAKTTS